MDAFTYGLQSLRERPSRIEPRRDG